MICDSFEVASNQQQSDHLILVLRVPLQQIQKIIIDILTELIDFIIHLDY